MMQWLSVFLAATGTLGVLAGLAVLLTHEPMPGERSRLPAWKLGHKLVAALNRYRSMERFLYRHHRILGTAVVAGALTFLLLLARLHSHGTATSAVPVVRLIMPLAWATSIGILVIGFYLLIRPSELKPFEAIANRWIEIFPSTKSAAVPPKGRDAKRPKPAARWVIGVLLVAAGVACLLAAAGLTGT